ncbi:MAG: Arc family DNA-binding protein [Chitinophagales bacterium]|nr:Arc family DNA-binding protein [Chitinophagales bacterium]
MSKKKSFVLRIDEETYASLEKWAADEFRSVNGQLEWIIDRSLKESGRMPRKGKREKKDDGKG